MKERVLDEKVKEKTIKELINKHFKVYDRLSEL